MFPEAQHCLPGLSLGIKRPATRQNLRQKFRRSLISNRTSFNGQTLHQRTSLLSQATAYHPYPILSYATTTGFGTNQRGEKAPTETRHSPHAARPRRLHPEATRQSRTQNLPHKSGDPSHAPCGESQQGHYCHETRRQLYENKRRARRSRRIRRSASPQSTRRATTPAVTQNPPVDEPHASNTLRPPRPHRWDSRGKTSFTPSPHAISEGTNPQPHILATSETTPLQPSPQGPEHKHTSPQSELIVTAPPQNIAEHSNKRGGRHEHV